MERKVIALVSGGLDSLLATRLMQLQGLEVLPVHLVSPWGCDEKALEAVERQTGLPVRRIERGTEYVSLVRNPVYGYGRSMNPCIDCRIFMFRQLAPLLEETGAAAVVTGEVVGQRPMSQVRRHLRVIDEESGLKGRILRPLSAKRLAPTEAEIRGIVNRDLLYDFAGRSRAPQLALAARLGITEYRTPAGGCKLTTPGFAPRLRDFFAHYADDAMEDAKLLNYGRHLRIDHERKLIVGRNREENRILETYAAGPGAERARLTAYVPNGFNGPTVLACGPVSDEVDETAGRAILRYARTQDAPPDGFTIRVVGPEGQRVIVAATALSEDELARLRIGHEELPVLP